MDVFLLGAGRPARGQTPSALKYISFNTRALDWQIHGLESIVDLENIHFLGGYHIDEIVEKYPQLKFTVIPDWETGSVLHTFLNAPFTQNSVVTAYSDTVFRKDVLVDMLAVDADVVFCVDSLWESRYEMRSPDDISSAETIEIGGSSGPARLVEFTGLMHFKSGVVEMLKNLEEPEVGSSLVDLIGYLKLQGLSIKPFDVAGHWAEFNSPGDIAHFIIGTKAETLDRLEPLVQRSHIGKQVRFTTAQWSDDPDLVLARIADKFGDTRLVVRSSSKGEDNWKSSNAGGFESLLNIEGGDSKAVASAIEIVIASYGSEADGSDQVLIQEFLAEVRLSGVVFTCGLESGSPYYCFNFDDKSNSTDSVTSGTRGDLRTVIVSRLAPEYLERVEPALVPALRAVEELEQLLGFDKLDIEFSIDESGLVHIFQVRPITVDHSGFEADLDSIEQSLAINLSLFENHQPPSATTFGDRAIFANMPDWNPAEMIGTRPKPLAFSLYRHLITNDIWAQQRAEFGYRDVRPCALIFSLSGQPYVDVRASLNSFIPADLPGAIATRLVNAYLGILSENPHYHDKVEFDVAFTVWTPGFFDMATARLAPYGVTQTDIQALEAALKAITCDALSRLDRDLEPLTSLAERRIAIMSSSRPAIDKMTALLEDCKRFGTLAFSHAARAGFVATSLLKGFVENGILSDARRLLFLRSFSTIAGEIEQDRSTLDARGNCLSELLSKYGHLRPGTYEIMSRAYWEDAGHYLASDSKHEPAKRIEFELSVTEADRLESVLNELGCRNSVDFLMQYLTRAIQAREYSKFEFTKNVSKALDICIEIGAELGLQREELSFLEYADLEQLKLNLVTAAQLREYVKLRKNKYAVTCLVQLPSLIRCESDFYCFERLTSQPNFVTNGKVEASVQLLELSQAADLNGKLVLIPQADPGYDWLFSQGIAGLITQYGGANSHMAIRAAEIGLPAAIGVGENLYESIADMKRVELDCQNHVIRRIL